MKQEPTGTATPGARCVAVPAERRDRGAHTHRTRQSPDGPAAARSTSRFARVRGLRKEVSSENESRLNPQDPHSRTTGRHSSHAGAGRGGRHRFRPQPRRRGPIGTTDVTRVIAPPPQGESAADPHINRSGSARTPSPALRTILYRLRGAHVTEHIGLERRPAHRPGPCRQRQSLARHTAQCVHPSRPW